MKRFSILIGLAMCVGLVLALNVTPAFGQGETGRVSGVVTDPQGAAVAGAEVAMTDVATKNPRTTTTGDTGRYYFAAVPVGVYDVTVTKSGFKLYKATAQKVSVGSDLTLDVTLEVGQLTETVVVTAQAGVELQTSNATVGNTINLKNLELLPNLGRDATTLMTLQPGVAPSNAAGQSGGSVAGTYMDQNTFTIDGGNNTDDMAGNTTGYLTNFTGTAGGQTNGLVSGVLPTPIESVEEFKVSTFGQTADFNNSSGASVQMVTRRGNDQFHGSGYGYYYATNHFAANSWVNNHTKFNKGIVPPSRPLCAAGTTFETGDNNCIMPYTPLIPNHRSRFGFSASGPFGNIKVGGHKTYFFVNYEGFRFPNNGTFERSYPTAAFRAGVIQVPDANGVFQPYNLNPFPVTVTVGSPTSSTAPVRTVTLPAAAGTNCSAAAVGAGCDPRGVGISPTVSTLWNKFLPLPNDPLAGDNFNYQGYLSTIRLPLTSNSYVGRIDHDFNSKERFFTSLRVFKLANITSNQVDVGGILNGGSVGTYTSSAPRPQTSELLVFGLTSTLNPRWTNDVRVSYLWNWWQWSTSGDPAQLPGLGGALEIAPGNTTSAESTGAFIPYNVNTQSTRQRIWDGQDKMIRDDATWVHGNHVTQFGGSYQRNFDFHNRTDNGSTVNNQIVYLISQSGVSFTAGCGSGTSTCIPSAVVAANQSTLYQRLAAEAMGIVAQTQVIYTRSPADLSILPLGTQATQFSTIPYYNFYGGDTWRLKPTVTLSGGLGYAIEMPPVEKNGAQVELVDTATGKLIDATQFLAARKAAALAGQAYAPVIGYETTHALGLKYPYNPYYKEFSPRVSIAWNPNFKGGWKAKLFGHGDTVIRGGYGRIFGRLNGVNQVLVPLLGPGLLQGVTCSKVASNNTCATTSQNVATAYRIGVDGLVPPLASPTATLPQPYIPGRVQNGILNSVAPDSTSLDPGFKPERTDNFNFSVQRNFGRKFFVEVGYLGRSIKNVYQEVNLDSVPYMMTLGGQTFANAYANIYLNICGTTTLCNGTGTPAAYSGGVQPFFEAALGGTGSAFCTGFASCTAALVAKSSVTGSSGFIPNTAVSELWAFLNSQTSWTLGRTMLSDQANSVNTITSLGYSNYNAGYISLQARDWHGVNAISNLTYSRALGLGELAQYNSSNTLLDPYNLKANYGPQNFDITMIFNAGISYQPRSLFGFGDFRSHHGLVGRLINGWTIAPFITAQSGLWEGAGYAEGSANCSACESFGSTGAATASSTSVDTLVAVLRGPYTGGHSANFGVIPASGVGSNNPTGVNMFADPNAIYNEFRRCILGFDTSCGGWGNIRGLPRWNVDLTVGKEVKFSERVGATLTLQITNVFNHFQPNDVNSLSLTTPTNFGRITSAAYASRQMEIGARIHF